MKYEVILFDADDTLFDFKKSERVAFRQTVLEFGLDYKEDYHFKLYKEINKAIWKELEAGLIPQKELNRKRFQQFTERLNAGLDELKLAKAYIKNLAMASFLFDFSMDLVKRLSETYRLSIVSNGLQEVQEGRIKKSPIVQYFEDVVISDEVGILKPDPGIFEIALKNLGYTDKSKVLMIGDSLTSDIQGGMNFGIDTCWYNPNRVELKPEAAPTYQLYDLTALPDLIEK